MNKFIFSCQADSEQLCINEMRNINKDIKLLKWLDGGVGLAGYNAGNNFSEISEIFREAKPVFLRHICPVDIETEVETEFETEEIEGIISKYKKNICKNTALSVQFRNKTENNAYNIYNSKEIKDYIINYFKDDGYLYSKSNPEVIISVFTGENKIYAGMSKSEENLSIWSGGMRHYAFNNQIISRAEFKLLELFEYFPDLLKNPGTALDLGASPGGWTKILAEKNFKVTAIDPNKLDCVLLSNPNIEYHKGLAENFENFISKNKKFDLIVNDMRMYAVQSAKIMIKAHGYLKENGCAVMTLKLNKDNKTKTIKDALNILREKYDVLFVKQLFHNRLEVTVVLRKIFF